MAIPYRRQVLAGLAPALIGMTAFGFGATAAWAKQPVKKSIAKKAKKPKKAKAADAASEEDAIMREVCCECGTFINILDGVSCCCGACTAG